MPIRILTLIPILALAACGGGGGGSSTPADTTAPVITLTNVSLAGTSNEAATVTMDDGVTTWPDEDGANDTAFAFSFDLDGLDAPVDPGVSGGSRAYTYTLEATDAVSNTEGGVLTLTINP